MTERKSRRIYYGKKAKQQRVRLYSIMIVIALLFACSLGTLADDGSHQMTVIVDAGDTLWALCEEYKPEKENLRLFIDKVMYLNQLDSACLSIGQEIVIPLD